jgi:hypothetical protein
MKLSPETIIVSGDKSTLITRPVFGEYYNPFAVQRLLGHANLMMATQYVQDVSTQTDGVIIKSRKYVT